MIFFFFAENRVIFSVDALTEGWDVLSLYDIIHFDISAAKKVSLQDIQLIGRGARLCPYKLHKSYRLNNDNLGLFDKEHGYEFDQYKRKFDNAIDEYGRVLETFMYHFVKTGTFNSDPRGETDFALDFRATLLH